MSMVKIEIDHKRGVSLQGVYGDFPQEWRQGAERSWVIIPADQQTALEAALESDDDIISYRDVSCDLQK